MKTKLGIIIIASIVLVTTLACQFTGISFTPTAETLPTLASDIVPVDLSTQQNVLMTLYDQYSPGVVSILTSTGQGSGWVYDGEGYIVTNNHVVEGETRVEIDFSSGYKTYGDVIGTDAYSDLAVIKVDVPASELFPLPLGDSDSLKVGQIGDSHWQSIWIERDDDHGNHIRFGSGASFGNCCTGWRIFFER